MCLQMEGGTGQLALWCCWPCSHCFLSTRSPSVATMHLSHVVSRKPDPMPMMLFCEGHIFHSYFWLGSGGIVQGGVGWAGWGSLRHSVSGPSGRGIVGRVMAKAWWGRLGGVCGWWGRQSLLVMHCDTIMPGWSVSVTTVACKDWC